MKYRYQIKILSGPLSGRRLRLPEGEFTIGGADPDLDAMLEGGGSAVLDCTEQGVLLRTEVPVWIEGVPTRMEQAPLPLEKVVDIGGLALLVGGAERALPERKVPPRRDGRRGMAATVLAYAGLVLLMSGSAGAAIWAYGMLQPDSAVVDRDEWLTEWRKRARQQGIDVATQQDGLTVLGGSCLDSSARDALVDKLREHGKPYRDNTLCQDELVRNVQAVLNLHGFGEARARPGPAGGTVVIQGTIHADARWRRAVSMLSSMQGLQRWSVEDPVGASVKTLIGMLRDAGLIGRLSVAREKDLILITGVLDEGGQRSLSAVTHAFAGSYPEAPKVIFQNIPTRSIQTGIFPAPVVSFGGSGELAFLDLANGTRLKTGSRLPAGHVIVHLDRNGIDLEREGELMHLPLEL